MALKRYPNGIHEPFFFQKRAPDPRPDFIETSQSPKVEQGGSVATARKRQGESMLPTPRLGC